MIKKNNYRTAIMTIHQVVYFSCCSQCNKMWLQDMAPGGLIVLDIGIVIFIVSTLM